MIGSQKNEMLVQVRIGSDFNFIAGNTLEADASGSQVFPNGAKMGIWLEIAEHKAFQGNLIAGSRAWGLVLGFGWDKPVANFNIVRANIISQNQNLGIKVQGGAGNTIVVNMLTGNGQNASDDGRDNRWDDGRAGNIWSDYQGTDHNSDGIGDIPYAVSPNGVDHYPLMIPPR